MPEPKHEEAVLGIEDDNLLVSEADCPFSTPYTLHPVLSLALLLRRPLSCAATSAFQSVQYDPTLLKHTRMQSTDS